MGIVQPDLAAERGRGSTGWLLGVVVTLAIGGAAAWALQRSGGPDALGSTGVIAQVETPAVAGAPERQPEAEDPAPAESASEERIKTPEEQIAEAELARVQREGAQAEAERAERAEREQRRELASKQRELEDQARDRQRHEQVQRDLDETRLRAARRNVSIVMYSTTWCVNCTRARAYMQQKNIPFSELDVDRDPTARAQADALNSRGSVPTISIDGDVMVGFSPSGLESRIDRAARKRAGG